MVRTFECTATIAAPPNAVFAALVDVGSYGLWMPNFVRVERDGSGPLQAGDTFRETRRVFGSESTEHFEVVAVEAPDRLVLRVDGSKGTTGKGVFTFEHRLDAHGVGSRLTLHGTVDMPGLVAQLLGGVFVGMFKSAIAKDMAALGRWVATRPAVDGGA